MNYVPKGLNYVLVSILWYYNLVALFIHLKEAKLFFLTLIRGIIVVCESEPTETTMFITVMR